MSEFVQPTVELAGKDNFDVIFRRVMDSPNHMSELRRWLSDLEFEESQRLCHERIKNGVNHEDEIRRKKDFFMGIIGKLVGEKEKFQHVFTTEQGSIYFVGLDGASLRFKLQEQVVRDGLSIVKPISNHICFVDENTAEVLLQKMREPPRWDSDGFGIPAIVDFQFSIVPLSVGVHPFEFGFQNYPEAIIEQGPHTIKILGTEDTEESNGVDKSYASGTHLGHKVLEIFK